MAMGKFKTEGSIGMAVRALANNHKVLFMQFLKDGCSSEVDFFNSLNNANIIIKNTSTSKFKITEQDKVKCRTMLQQIINYIKDNKYNLVIMDEILVCLDMGIIPHTDINELVTICNANDVDLCMTGRLSSKVFREFINRVSDIASNNRCEKHCFNTYCSKCGRDYKYHYKFCPQCGNKLKQSDEPKKGRDY